MNYQHYRATTLGSTLQETLDEMMERGDITQEIVNLVLQKYDKSVTSALKEHGTSNMTFTAGRLHTFRFCDNVWTLILKDAEFREDQHSMKVDVVKVVACLGKDNVNE
ncbi:transcription initiation factor IIA subunit 2-2 [Drosophila sechellia]|uniref:Transcription initiation factor IIA subunit 2 n=1 Tax=Drosophila sechellia TaxID=7238 RepID=B4I989_DROSE|nr:transcription initiation factor IIA subunit 2-2 [Drosophila sechellia]EDW43770.1 GM19003 [Drosophila sechellia]